MKNIVITGANRGIGLALSKQYLAKGQNVLACCRAPTLANELNTLINVYPTQLQVFTLDVSSETSINELSCEIGDKPISLLINNAGVCLDSVSRIGNLSFTDWAQMFLVNTIAPVSLTEALLPSLASSGGARVVNISSDMGSVTLCDSDGYYGYRASKSALNSVTKSLSFGLKPHNISVFALHPGWVKTRIGGNGATLDAEESAATLVKSIEALDVTLSGGFFNLDGSTLAP